MKTPQIVIRLLHPIHRIDGNAQSSHCRIEYIHRVFRWDTLSLRSIINGSYGHEDVQVPKHGLSLRQAPCLVGWPSSLLLFVGLFWIHSASSTNEGYQWSLSKLFSQKDTNLWASFVRPYEQNELALAFQHDHTVILNRVRQFLRARFTV